MNTDELIEILLGRATRKIPGDSVPDYLANKYDREGAAINLGNLGLDDPKIVGALVKVCLLDEEEDVRFASFDALLKINKEISIPIAHCLLDDDDENIREYAKQVVDESGK